MADTEGHTTRVIGMVPHRREKKVEAVAVSAAMTSERNIWSVVDTLHEEIRVHLSQSRADFKRRQDKTKQIAAKVSKNLEILTKQLNSLHPASGADVESL